MAATTITIWLAQKTESGVVVNDIKATLDKGRLYFKELGTSWDGWIPLNETDGLDIGILFTSSNKVKFADCAVATTSHRAAGTLLEAIRAEKALVDALAQKLAADIETLEILSGCLKDALP